MSEYREGTFAPIMVRETKAEQAAKALGFMLDKVLPKAQESKPEVIGPMLDETIEAMFMARNKEACIMECAIVEALTWLDAQAPGKAYGTLSQVMEKLSAMRVKEGQ